MPCIGCYGAPPGVIDQGARMMSAVASVVGSNDPAEIRKMMEGIVDPGGTFYKFSLAHSLLHRARTTD
jgi:F420-non-reducing hydrogenase small subunit